MLLCSGCSSGNSAADGGGGAAGSASTGGAGGRGGQGGDGSAGTGGGGNTWRYRGHGQRRRRLEHGRRHRRARRNRHWRRAPALEDGAARRAATLLALIPARWSLEDRTPGSSDVERAAFCTERAWGLPEPLARVRAGAPARRPGPPPSRARTMRAAQRGRAESVRSCRRTHAPRAAACTDACAMPTVRRASSANAATPSVSAGRHRAQATASVLKGACVRAPRSAGAVALTIRLHAATNASRQPTPVSRNSECTTPLPACAFSSGARAGHEGQMVCP